MAGPSLRALGHCKVPASSLPQAAGLARVTVSQERSLTRKVASQTDDMYNRILKISIFIHMRILCYVEIKFKICYIDIAYLRKRD